MQGRNSRSHTRRSIRIQLRVPVTVSGVDSSGFRFEFVGETVIVSKHGARVRTKQLPETLCCGMEIRVNKARDSRGGRVVWVKSGAECGVEIHEPGNFWSVTFPTRTAKESPAGKHAGRLMPNPEEPGSTPVANRPLPAKVSDLSASQSGIPAQTGEPMVLVTGLSANYSYFQERTTLRTVDSYEASVVMRQRVSAGTSLRVHVSGRTVNASVLDVQHGDQPNRSFVRLRFTEPLNQEKWASERAARRTDGWKD